MKFQKMLAIPVLLVAMTTAVFADHGPSITTMPRILAK